MNPPTPNMLKLVHYLARNISKRAVGIRLKCLLVVFAVISEVKSPYLNSLVEKKILRNTLLDLQYCPVGKLDIEMHNTLLLSLKVTALHLIWWSLVDLARIPHPLTKISRKKWWGCLLLSLTLNTELSACNNFPLMEQPAWKAAWPNQGSFYCYAMVSVTHGYADDNSYKGSAQWYWFFKEKISLLSTQ